MSCVRLVMIDANHKFEMCTGRRSTPARRSHPGSEQEVEIRACTVVAVEQLRDALVAKYGALAAVDGRVKAARQAATEQHQCKSRSGDICRWQHELSSALCNRSIVAETH